MAFCEEPQVSIRKAATTQKPSLSRIQSSLGAEVSTDYLMSFPEKHFEKTRQLAKSVQSSEIASWLLIDGYFPEQYVLPPSFKIEGLTLKKQPYNSNLKDLTRRQLLNISFPKTTFTSREFGLMHPWNYHDIVFHIVQEWDFILDHLFSDEQKIYSYSFPVPVSARNIGGLSTLRSGRMIYEWIAMAEGDLVVEAHNYRRLIRTDVTNCYPSIYTHSIAWALHGRDEARKDIAFTLVGNKIDRLVQYANDGRTNGLAIGPALSDLICEIVLTRVDLNASERLKEMNFVGTRYKDDYRILCNSEEDAKTILKIISEVLTKFNLSINENKTRIVELPTGLYREHDREYFQFSIKKKEIIDFKTFEHAILKVLEIHRRFPNTSILEKFFSELFDQDYQLKLEFSANPNERLKQILKTFSLMIMVTRESEKTLCHILSVIEEVYNAFKARYDLKGHLKDLIEHELKYASDRKSAFSVVWYIFFARYLGLGIDRLKGLIAEDILSNDIVKSVYSSRQKMFADSGVVLFRTPRMCRGTSLAKQCAVFNRNKDGSSILDEVGQSLVDLENAESAERS